MFPGVDFGDESGDKEPTIVLEHDILRALVSIIDVAGLYFVLNAKRLVTIMGDIDIKILAIGLGWAAAELLTSNFLDIIF